MQEDTPVSTSRALLLLVLAIQRQQQFRDRASLADPSPSHRRRLELSSTESPAIKTKAQATVLLSPLSDSLVVCAERLEKSEKNACFSLFSWLFRYAMHESPAADDGPDTVLQ